MSFLNSLYLKSLFTSAKLFLFFFILSFLVQFIFNTNFYISFGQSYLFTSVSILLPGVGFIFSGEKPLNPLGYSVVVVLFIISMSIIFFILKKKYSSFNNFINKLDFFLSLFIVLILLLVILMFPYYQVMDFF